MNAPNAARALEAAFPRSRGLTLVEILVALLVLSIGLLGLAALQNTSLQFNTGAYYRTQATALAYDLTDRMRANRQAALDGAYTSGFEDAPACEPDVALEGDLADQDLAIWRNALACRIPQATGAVELNGNEVTVTVTWEDRNEADAVPFEMTTAL